MRVAKNEERPMLKAEHTKMSDLLEAALNDLKHSIAAGRNVQMDAWFRTEDGRICSVCLSGAVMLRGLGDGYVCEATDPRKLQERGFCTPEVMEQLYALDFMRMGDFENAYRAMPGFSLNPNDEPERYDLLNELESMVEDSGLSINGDWIRTEYENGRNYGVGHLVPGPMLEYFEDTIVPEMRARGI